MKKILLGFIAVIFILSVSILNGCGDSTTGPGTTTGTTVTTTIIGVVVNETGQPVAGANVTSHGQTTTSGSSGEFVFNNIQVPTARLFVNANMSGYFKASRGETPVSAGITQVRITMMQKTITHTINSVTGGSADLSNGSKVEIQPNSVVLSNGTQYNGTVNMSVVYMDPTTNDFSATVAGGDLAARRTDSSNVYLTSYGVLKVVLEGTGGEALQLQTGQTSTITTMIPNALSGNAPSTIPLWYFDDALGLWREEGTATLQGDKYVGTVKHFTDWNCDAPGYITSVKGRVLDCNNQPLGGITIKVGQGTTVTDASGNFRRNVPAGVAFNVSIEANQNFGLSAPPAPVPALTPNTIYTVPDFHVSCYPVIKGRFIDCNSNGIVGIVSAMWGGQTMGVTFSGGQGFSMVVAPNVQLNLKFVSYTGLVKDTVITTPSTAIVMDLGNMSLCGAVSQGDNSFTINGAGFVNQHIVLNAQTAIGFYSISIQSTSVNAIENQANFIALYFPGNTTGNFTNQDGVVHLQNVSYNSSVMNVNVTGYDAVGGVIKGNFNGIFESTTDTVTISNGNFFVIRQPDQN